MSVTFNPADDIPDLSGKTILITGGNAGLGAATATALAAHNPAHLYLTARRTGSADALISDIRATGCTTQIHLLDLDLSSFASVRAAAARFTAEQQRLDVLLLNAGVSATAPAQSREGYELQFGTNHMGHALLTQLLMPKLLHTAALPSSDVRVVVLSSVGHRSFPPKCGIDFDSLKTTGGAWGPLALYAQSKLANILFVKGMAERYPQVTSVAVHPGTVASDIWGKAEGVNAILRWAIKPFVWLTASSSAEGAKTQLWAATAGGVRSGAYYEPVGKPNLESKLARDPAMIEKMWHWTEKELQSHETQGWPASKL